MDRVKDKVAIITGSASGIGEATAKLLAREGAIVAVVDIDDENGERVGREINSSGGEAVFHHMDVSREREVEQVINSTYNKYERLNILINNEGIASVGRPTHLLSNEDWDKVMSVDLKGPFWCVKYAVPYILKSGGGSVVNICSIMGMLGGPATGYNTAKGALRQLTKCDAFNYAQDKIRFNSIYPGYIITPLFKKLASKSPEGIKGSILKESKKIPLGRMGLPEDIANGILFLASDESSYITGAELIIDGGCIIV